MSAPKPLLHEVPGVRVGFVARSVSNQVPTSPELSIKVYGAPAGGVARARAAVSSIPSFGSFQLGVEDEALRVSQTPPPWTYSTWSRLDGSISMSSGQPQNESAAGVCGMAAAISRQVVPPSSDSWMIFWPLKLPQELVTPSAMRVLAPVPETDTPPRP